MADDKTKILHLLQLLLEETDAANPLNAAQIAGRLEQLYGYATYNRKTIYKDIERLKAFGLQIAQTKGADFGYYVEKRDFDLAELKLLVDAVQSSKFITRNKTEDLIRKLGKLTSKANERHLRRQVFIYNRVKSENDSIYANVNIIHDAINGDHQVRFQYCEWTVQKTLVPRKDGGLYHISPWALTWDDENYYLVGFDSDLGMIRHYRVDKMQRMELTDLKRLGREQFENFDLAAFAKKTFGMYGGKDMEITLACENHLVGVIIDRFGKDVMIIPKGDTHFKVNVKVTVSPQFFGWLTAVGKGIRIAWPEEIAAEYKVYLVDLATN